MRQPHSRWNRARDPERVSQQLSWKDFEQLAAGILSSLGYRTRTNVRFTKPRMELDVVGVSAGLAIAVDCKHWSRASLLSQFCTKQAARAQELVRRDSSIREAVPAILTLHAARVRFAAGVPVVPVAQFRSFVIDVRGFMEEIRVVRQGPA
ncbi:restriction endonuclease [Candidatus Nitrososphaera sp. FF02]|uniref:restriction endonuclease n=1 Tax=Candidatus Nitrososphaera sp. FF02 TaxID=3398226 RepID=UPI0039EBE104